MSTYNESLLVLSKSIQSILNQTYSNIEFLIVIDNPNNHELINYLKNIDDNRVKLIINDKNIGLPCSLNNAIKECSGVYIARMDADDISEINRLQKQKEFLEKNNCDLVASSIQLIDEDDTVINKYIIPHEENTIKKALKKYNCLPHPTWFAKKELFIDLKGYRDIPRCEDYDFLLRAMIKNKKLYGMENILLKYRIRQNSITQSNNGEQHALATFLSKQVIEVYDIKDIYNYMNTSKFKKDAFKYNRFIFLKNKIKKDSISILDFLELLLNKNLYIFLINKLRRN